MFHEPFALYSMLLGICKLKSKKNTWKTVINSWNSNIVFPRLESSMYRKAEIPELRSSKRSLGFCNRNWKLVYSLNLFTTQQIFTPIPLRSKTTKLLTEITARGEGGSWNVNVIKWISFLSSKVVNQGGRGVKKNPKIGQRSLWTTPNWEYFENVTYERKEQWIDK